jgi:release factor glutamine methyltransferase
MAARVIDLLEDAGIDAREARMLLAAASGMGTALLAAFPEREIDQAAGRRFAALARRRREGVPVAYILGRREFYSRSFVVTPDVLIPRPETELLVELALARIAPDQGEVSVLDLGTGSGAVAVSIACDAEQARVTGVDASAEALAVARGNAQRLAPDNEMDFVQSDWFSALGGARYDLIVGNPPYVAELDDHLLQGDLRFEPPTALASGPAGLDALTIICAQAPQHLKPGAWLLLEHGYDQGEAVRRLLAAAGLAEATTWRDLAGLERVSGARAA